MSDLITPTKRQPVTYTYRLPPFTLTVTRRLDTTGPRSRFAWTGTATHTPTRTLVLTAVHDTGIGENPINGPDGHDMLARLLVWRLTEEPATAHQAEFVAASAPLRPATYRLPADPTRPATTRYRLGAFELHLTDHGIREVGGRAESRFWNTRLTRAGEPVEPEDRVYGTHPDRDADSLLAFVLATYTATPGPPHAAELAAATAPLHIATYRDPTPSPAAPTSRRPT